MCLSLPQLYKILKDKKTGNINFTSFWIFHLGILGWVIYGVTNPNHLYNVVIADGLSVFVNGVMTGLLYYYKKEFSQRQKMFGYLGILATWGVAIILIGFYIKEESSGQIGLITMTENQSAIFGYTLPALTTFAFAPQLIQSFITKKWQGISVWMFVLYEINNVAWIIWWIIGILQNQYDGIGYQSLIAGLIWQIISLTIFGVQLTFTVLDIRKNKQTIQQN
ncbi:PQ-loop domain-containing transporter [Mycoplasmopsis gallopavonis]|uniref:PQ-loop domain-containing transporter n=1 Tax=Mycoplasmopsis gallopavonis TaxID=76629 RepID=UPI001CB76C87